MRVAAVNTGSSSLKLSVVEPDDTVRLRHEVERWAGEDQREEIAGFFAEAGEIGAVTHRVVHGGERFDGAVRVDDEVVAAIAALSELAPLHQPRALAALRAVGQVVRDVPVIACFDTAFHRTMPDSAALYALPAEWRDRWPLRRFGFHGLSHAWAARRTSAMLGRPVEDLRTVTCHLGAGASLCAVAGGRSVDTTMGFTPLEGLVMATRSGSVDPGLVLWLVDRGLHPHEVLDALEHRSGLAGLSGGSGDMRDVLSAIAAGDERAAVAFDVYVARVRGAAAAMVSALGGLDALVFTAGVGEHAPEVRAAVAAGLAHLGVALDERANLAAHGDADIGRPGAAVRSLVVTACEDVEMAGEARALLAGASAI